MAKLAGEQLSLIAELEFDDRRVGDWGWDDVGTEQISVPTLAGSKVGTKQIPVPTLAGSKIGTKEIPVPIFTVDFRVTEKWHPPVGCLEQKWSKDRKYWYWRYYDNRGKKRSLYLAKDYNKSIRKAMKIGVPSDAKSPQPTSTKTDPQNPNPTASNLIDITQTADCTSSSTRAA